jgi:mono/diheme cytochrome c family protein
MGADVRRAFRTVWFLYALFCLSGCQQAAEPPAPDAPPFDLGFDMKTLMTHVIEAAAETAWDSAGQIVTAEGEQDLAPVDDEGWYHVEAAGATLVEAGNLLLLPGRDPGKEDWQAFAKSLSLMGHRVKDAARARDRDALFQAGADLYSACVACHQAYALNLPVKVDLKTGNDQNPE